MREIEFRCWNKSDKEFEYLEDMVINDIVLSLPSCKIYKINRYYDDLYDQFGIEKIDVTDEYELLQYTGLKDKHGKKIFEGDIVYSEQWNPQKYVIAYEDGGFVLKYEDSAYYPNAYHATVMEIIGNKFDNPELLEGR